MANKNSNLGAAKTAKNDEFYTQYSDIEREMNAYLEYDANVFRGKTILLPCDDPEWSNFTKYFAQNFEAFGLKKLISTSYAPESKKIAAWQPTLFETEAPQYDEDKSKTHGKIFILDSDTNGSGRIDVEDLRWEYLEGDGDFRSDEVKKLRDEADVIITNPPFSLFREFLAWIMNADKKFVVLANKGSVGYKEVFPLIRDNKVWSGRTEWGGGMWFQTLDEDDVDKIINGVLMKNVPSIWLTNIEHGRRHLPMQLMSMADNIKYSKHKEIRGHGYVKYDNYDALDIPYTDSIPFDYDDLMGVPVSFLDKFCPEQFEIVSMGEGELFFKPTKFYEYFLDAKTGKKSNAKRDYQLYVPNENGAYITNEGTRVDKAYKRILIRKKK